MNVKETVREKWFAQTPQRRSAIAIIGGIVAVAIILIAVLQLSSTTAGWWSNRKTDKVLEKVEKLEQQNKVLLEANITLRAEADQYRGQAVLKEQEAEALRQTLPKYDARINAQTKAIEETFNDLQTDSAITGADVSDDVRRQRICSKLAQSNTAQPDARKRIKLSICG